MHTSCRVYRKFKAFRSIIIDSPTRLLKDSMPINIINTYTCIQRTIPMTVIGVQRYQTSLSCKINSCFSSSLSLLTYNIYKCNDYLFQLSEIFGLLRSPVVAEPTTLNFLFSNKISSKILSISDSLNYSLTLCLPTSVSVFLKISPLAVIPHISALTTKRRQIISGPPNNSRTSLL